MGFWGWVCYGLIIYNSNRQKKHDHQVLNPYDLAMDYTFEKIINFLEKHHETNLPIAAELRGRNEDSDLKTSFHHLLTYGNNFIAAQKFQNLNCSITFRRKHDNITGMQIADLCAHPNARKILDPNKTNKVFDIIASNFIILIMS